MKKYFGTVSVILPVNLLALSLATPVLAGVKLVGELHQASQKLPLSLYLEKTKVRMDSQSPTDATQKHRLIFDAATDNLAYLDDKRKTVLQMPVAQLEMFASLAAKLQNKGGMKIQGPNRTPKQTITFKSTTRTKKIGKWNCKIHELYRQKTKLGEICTAPLSEVGLTKADMAPLQKLSASLKPLVAAAPGGAPDYPDYLWDRLEELGITLEANSTDPATKKTHRFLMSSVSKENIAESNFAVPADYKPMGFGK